MPLSREAGEGLRKKMKSFDVNRFDYLMASPYRHMGRDPKEGLDCYGLVMQVYADLERPLPDYRYAEDGPEQGSFIAEHYHELWEKIPEGRGISPGDVLLMYMFEAAPNHVGVYLGEAAGEKWVLHMTKTGPVKERLRNLSRRVAGVYRLKSPLSPFVKGGQAEGRGDL